MNFIRLLSYIPLLRHAIIPLFLLVLFTIVKVGHIVLTMLLYPAVYDSLFVSFDFLVLFKIVILQLVLLILTLVIDIGSEIVASHLQHKLSLRIKVKLANRAFHLPLSYFREQNSGELSKFIIKDTELVTMGLKELVLSINFALQIVLMLIGSYYIEPWYFKIYLIVTISYIAWNILWRPLFVKAVTKYNNINTDSYSFMWSLLESFKEVKVLGLEKRKLHTFKKIQEKQKTGLLLHDTFNFWMTFVNTPFSTLVYAAVLYISLIQVRDGVFSIGVLATYTTIVFILLSPVVLLMQSLSTIQIGTVGASLLHVFKKNSIEKSGDQNLEPVPLSLEINNLNFSYKSDRKILNNIQMNIPAGHHIGIVGKTGCGKSTITSLILKLFDGYNGDITVNGINLTDINNDSLRSNISYLGQDDMCLLGSIRDNIDLEGKFSDDKIFEVLESVSLKDYVKSLSGGLYSKVDDGSLSGGEKQRLLLARYILKPAGLFIFDEATSALDPKTERIVIDTINKLKKDRTFITISHRIENVKSCDNIYVLHEGQIVEEGNYSNLLANKKHFYNLFKLGEGDKNEV